MKIERHQSKYSNGKLLLMKYLLQYYGKMLEKIKNGGMID